MDIDKELIGKYALHSNGFGPVMKIVGHDIDRNLNLRYKCEWKENCIAVSSLFKRSELDVLSTMSAQPLQPKIAVKSEKPGSVKQGPPTPLDHLNDPDTPLS